MCAQAIFVASTGCRDPFSGIPNPKDSLGGQREDLPTVVPRFLGMSAVTAHVRELVLRQLNAMHGSGAVAFNRRPVPAA